MSVDALIAPLQAAHDSRVRRGKAALNPYELHAAAVLVVDFLLIVLASFAAVQFRLVLPTMDAAEGLEEMVRPVAMAIPFVWALLLSAFGAYQRDHFGTGTDEYRRVAHASFALAAVVSMVAYLMHYPLSRGYVVLLFMVGRALLILGRVILRRLVHQIRAAGYFTVPVLVVGAAQHVDDITAVLRRESWMGYQVRGALVDTGTVETAVGVPILGRVRDVLRTVRSGVARTVIFTEGAFDSSADFRRLAWEFDKIDVDVIVVPALTDISAQRLNVRPVAGLPLVHVDRPRAQAAGRWVKRAFDIVTSGSLLLSSPLIVAVSLAIWFEDRGRFFFKKRRAGLHGEAFDCFKFRSMVTDAEARLAALHHLNQGNGVLFKMANDPRITRVGRFIRRFSIDEIPQFWNVLRGDMSLVGPRPALMTEVARYDSDAVRRLHVRPGITGLWQVSGRSDLSWEDTVRLDLYYVDNWSMVQDISIIGKTAHAVLASRGAY